MLDVDELNRDSGSDDLLRSARIPLSLLGQFIKTSAIKRYMVIEAEILDVR